MAVGKDIGVNSPRSKATCFSEVFDPSTQRKRPSVVCDGCGFEESHGSSVNVPGTRLSRIFTRKGWKIDSKLKHAVCPACQKDEAMKKSPAVIKAERTMYSLLDAHYDADHRRYRDDYSDDRVAKESGLSVQVVSEVRETAYGSLVNPEVLAAEQKLEQLRKRVADLEELTKTELEQIKTDFARVRGVIQSAGR